MTTNTQNSKTLTGDILIIIAGLFWGSMGIFVRHLGDLGFTSIQIASLRLSCAAIIYVLILLVKDRRGFKIAFKDIPLFLGLGLLSILFFTYCYFTAIRIMTMSTAAILLYTSPIWVMLMSCIFFKEKLTATKVVALVLAFAGCALVSGIGGDSKLTIFGVLVGLGSGIGYGLYSILGTVALRKYSTYTVTTYTFIVAGAGSFLVADTPDMISKLQATNVGSTLGFVLLTSVITAVIPYLLYTLGLSKTIASKAAILATVEPVAATVFGLVVMHEKVSLLAFIGILLVLGAIVVLNIRIGKKG